MIIKKMKKLTLLFAFLCPFFALAQDQEGVIRYLITQHYSKKLAAVDYISKQAKERNEYIWGSRSEWKVYANLYFNATESKYEDSEEKAEPDEDNYSWKKDAFFIKRDFTKRTMYDVMTIVGQVYIVEDTIIYPEWKILNEMKEVAGHVCMNATYTDTLSKELVVGWFALDLPLNGGPERFGGLPGLILEIDINNGAVIISADKIDLKKLDQQLALPKKKTKGKKVNENGYREVLKKHYADKRKAEQPPYWGLRY